AGIFWPTPARIQALLGVQRSPAQLLAMTPANTSQIGPILEVAAVQGLSFSSYPHLALCRVLLTRSCPTRRCGHGEPDLAPPCAASPPHGSAAGANKGDGVQQELNLFSGSNGDNFYLQI
ncbi:unnamed protein product, partial [Urochloa humidicola]